MTVELTRTAEATGARSSQSWNGAVAIYGVRFDPRAFAARPSCVFTLEVASRPSVIELFTCKYEEPPPPPPPPPLIGVLVARGPPL